MKKQYLLPVMDLLIFVEEDILTDSSITTTKTAIDFAADALNEKNNNASVKMSSVIVLE